MHFTRIRVCRSTAILVIGSLLASMTVGCGGGSTDRVSEDGASAVMVDEMKPVNAKFIGGPIRAQRADLTGAQAWRLFSVSTSDIGKDHKSFQGYVAYGTDRNNQVIWSIVIDADGTQHTMKVEPGGETSRITLPADLQQALSQEVENLWAKSDMDHALSGASSSGTWKIVATGAAATVVLSILFALAG